MISVSILFQVVIDAFWCISGTRSGIQSSPRHVLNQLSELVPASQAGADGLGTLSPGHQLLQEIRSAHMVSSEDVTPDPLHIRGSSLVLLRHSSSLRVTTDDRFLGPLVLRYPTDPAHAGGSSVVQRRSYSLRKTSDSSSGPQVLWHPEDLLQMGGSFLCQRCSFSLRSTSDSFSGPQVLWHPEDPTHRGFFCGPQAFLLTAQD